MNAQNINPDRILTLGEAVKLTGFSSGKFRYQKDRLVAAGVTVTESGWSIPMSVLEELGWVGAKPAKGVVVETPLSVAQSEVARLTAEVTRLTAELEEVKASRRPLFGRKK